MTASAARRVLRLDAAGATDIGRRRTRNEDAFTVAPTTRLFAVADGLASRPYGHVASALAVEAVTDVLKEDVPAPAEGALWAAGDVCARFTGALNCAHERIRREATGPRLGMATTFAGALVCGDAVCVAHIGDSRAYRLRDGELTALTEDHVLFYELVASGVPWEEAIARPDRGALTRTLGSTADHTPSVRLETAHPGDVLLLCSDGLHRMVPRDELELILLAFEPASLAVERLIEHANRCGGRDNITAVVIRWGAEP